MKLRVILSDVKSDNSIQLLALVDIVTNLTQQIPTKPSTQTV